MHSKASNPRRIAATVPMLVVFVSTYLCGLGQSAWAAEEPEEPPKKPGFWKRLATEGMTIEFGKDGVRTGPGGATPSAHSSARLGDVYGGDTDQPMYSSVSGGDRLLGIFTSDDTNKARKGFLDWPRVAVTFKEFGIHEPCWLLEARIWSNATDFNDETFRLCTAPIVMKDDLGQNSYLNRSSAMMMASGLEGRSLHLTENSGGQRTKGPLPPLKPFQMNIRVQMQPGGLHASSENIHHRLGSMMVRLAWVTGFIRPSEIEDAAFMGSTSSADKRLWIAGFDLNGNRDSAP